MTDIHLALLQKIDRQVEEQSRDLKSVASSIADGRVRFENHAARIVALERAQAAAPEQTKRAVREVLAEQRETDRVERSRDTTALVKAGGKLGKWIRAALVAGVAVGGCVAGYVAAKPAAGGQAVAQEGRP